LAEIEVNGFDKALQMVVGYYPFEVEPVREDVIQHDDMAKVVQNVHSVAQPLGLADYRQIEHQAHFAPRTGCRELPRQ
jgi:hypothetical protein